MGVLWISCSNPAKFYLHTASSSFTYFESFLVTLGEKVLKETLVSESSQFPTEVP